VRLDDDDGPDDVTVRHIQPYQAVKAYRCPGCDHEIAPGVGHKVVVPLHSPDLRRHWHTPCWESELRRHGRGGSPAAATRAPKGPKRPKHRRRPKPG
jgi:hypothetical protein